MKAKPHVVRAGLILTWETVFPDDPSRIYICRVLDSKMKHLPREAGFWYTHVRHFWYTDSYRIAATLLDYADDECRRHITMEIYRAQERHRTSARSTTSDDTP